MASNGAAAALAEVLRDHSDDYAELERREAAVTAREAEHKAKAEAAQRAQDARERSLREREHQADLTAARHGALDARVENLARREAACRAAEATAAEADETMRRRSKAKYTHDGEPTLVWFMASTGDAERVLDQLPTASWRWSRAIPAGGPTALIVHARQALATASYCSSSKPDAQQRHLRRVSGSRAEAEAA